MPNFKYRALTQSGEIVSGSIAAPVTASVGWPDDVAPSEPDAAVAPAVAIRHWYVPGGASVESHVQSTVDPVPEPVPAVAPVASVTVTVHALDDEIVAWNRTGAPTCPVTFGP